MKAPAESRPSSFEAIFAAYAVVATFALGYGYWRLATRQNEQDARIEQQRQEQQAAVTRLQREADDKRTTDDLEIQVHLSRIASPFEIKGIGSGGGDVATDRGGGRRAAFFERTPGPGTDGGKDQGGERSDHSIPAASHGRGTRHIDVSAGRLARPAGDPPRRRSEAR